MKIGKVESCAKTTNFVPHLFFYSSLYCINWRELTPCRIRMDPGSGGLGEIDYPGLPGNTVGMATMVDTSEASKQKSEKRRTLRAESFIKSKMTQ